MAQSVGLIAVETLVIAVLFEGWPSISGNFLPVWIAVFLLPGLLAALLTGPIASIFGGRLNLRRSLLLSLSSGVLPLPFALGWRVALALNPAGLPSVPATLLACLGPVLWLRQMSLFGISSPSHGRSLPPALVAPLLSVIGVFLVFPPTVVLVVEATIFFAIGFASCALLLRAADRPLRREFGISGVSLIRPMLDHINERDPQGGEALEAFFARFSILADLRLLVVGFWAGGRAKATMALPTVHPGPFGALGASDLPNRLAERLGPSAGLLFVPHTPCNHDQDLPTKREFDRLGDEAQAVLDSLGGRAPATGAPVTSPLVAARPGSLARVQLLGDVAVVLVSQAPEPTDDIDLAVVDPLVRRLESAGPRRLAVIDAHNSYVEDQGDLSYGTPKAGQLIADIEASLSEAEARAKPGAIRIGTAHRAGYSLGEDGIGPAGIRALVVGAAGTTTAYVLIDGNNLVLGIRAKLLDALQGRVDAAEIMTTDNHIVHEVDGGTNPVGERYPVESLTKDVGELVNEAIADLTEVEVRAGSRALPAIPVLQPGWTNRLLTSLGDTLSMFTNALLTTFLLVETGSLVVLLALR